MDTQIIDSRTAQQLAVQELFQQLASSPQGLSGSEVRRRLAEYGPNAIEEARRIFERMNSYAIYRITETIRIMIFVVAGNLGDVARYGRPALTLPGAACRLQHIR